MNFQQNNKNNKKLSGTFFAILFMAILVSFFADSDDEAGILIFSLLVPIAIFIFIVVAVVKYGRKNLNGDSFNGDPNNTQRYDDHFTPTNTPPVDANLHDKDSLGNSTFDKNVDKISAIDKRLVELREQYNNYKISSEAYYAEKEKLEKQLAALKNKIV